MKPSGAYSLLRILWLLPVLLLLIAAITFGGLLFYRSQAEKLHQAADNELNTIAHAKVNQIMEYRAGCLSNAGVIMDNPLFIQEVTAWTSSPRYRSNSTILAYFRAIQKNQHYDDIMLIDPAGNLLLSIKAKYPRLTANARNMLAQAFQENRPLLTDLHQSSTDRTPHFDAIAPLSLVQKNGVKKLAAVILHIRADQYLYPLLRSWPAPSRTAEVLLVRRDGSNVLFLNELRYQKNTALQLRIPLTRTDVPAVMVIQGKTGVVDGRDYRGVPVLAALQPVPGSPWFIVAKMDSSEALASWHSQGGIILALTLTLLIFAFSLALYFWEQGRKAYYKARYETEQERQALRNHYESLIEYANDIIILSNQKLQILEANKQAVEIYGYSHEELLALSLTKLIAPDELPAFTKRQCKLMEKSELRTESRHCRKDGSIFPVEVSARLFEINGQSFHQSIVRDISERKAAEATLRESEERFRKTFEDGPMGMLLSDDQFRFILVNPRFSAMLGYSPTELFGKTFIDITHPEHLQSDVAGINQLQSGKISVYTTEKRYLKKDGSTIWGTLTVTVIRDINGAFLYFLAIIDDITDRKHAEEALQFMTSRQQTLLSAIPDIIMEVDIHKIYTWANPAGSEFFGADAIGKPAEYYFEGAQTTYQTVQPLFDGAEETIYVESWQRRKDGAKRLLAWWCKTLKDSSGQVTGALSSARDITEHYEMETALRESEENFRLLVENAPDAIYIQTNKRFAYLNKAALHLYGASRPGDLLGTPILDRFHPDYHAAVNERLRLLNEERKTAPRIEQKIIRCDGSFVDIEVTAVPFHYQNEDGSLVFIRDITERKMAEEAARINEARLGILYEISQYPSTNLQELLDYALEQAIQLTGSKIGYIYFYDEAKEEFTLNSWSREVMKECSVLNPQTLYRLEKTGIWGEAVRQRKPITVNDFHAPHPLKKGYPKGHVELRRFMTIPIFDEGKIVAVVAVANKEDPYGELDLRQLTLLMDSVWKVTERRRVEGEIHRLNEELETRVRERTAKLEAANRELESFSYSVSHDLRAPLRAIDGFSQILFEDYGAKLDEEGREICQVVRSNAQRMGQLIDDLLAFARLGRTELEPRSIDMHDLWETLSQELISPADRKRINFKLGALPKAYGDPSLLRQAVTNLLANAIKFSSKQQKAVIQVGSKNGPDETIYFISDNGSGFDMRYSDKLFGVFQRLHAMDEFEGTGVGLAIVKRIIDKHGGRVWAEGKIDEGATFYFTLPKQRK